MILRAEEESLPFEVLESSYRSLIDACDRLDCSDINDILREHVLGFSCQEPRHDFIWVKQGLSGKRSRKVVEGGNVSVLPTAATTSVGNPVTG